MNYRMTPELERALQDLVYAIVEEGPQPRLHRRVVKRHRKEWPRLWAAIDKIMRNLPNDYQRTT